MSSRAATHPAARSDGKRIRSRTHLGVPSMLDAVRSPAVNGNAQDAVPHEAARLKRAAWAFTTRRIRAAAVALVHSDRAPRAGDLVLARVDAIGYHSALQS